MMREVIGSIMAGTSALYLLWFILPQVTMLYEYTKTTVDQTNPTIATFLILGDGVYSIIGFIVILVTGFLIMSYATRREPYDA